jgi:methyl-accepting chemotaxis protein
MSFLNFRIRGRLYGGFAILLVFCAGLAGFAVMQLTALRDQVDLLGLQSSNAIRASEIATELQAIRRGILRYTFDQDEASFAESDKRLAHVAELLDQAVATTRSEERRAAYRIAVKDIADLKNKRAELGDAVKQMLAGRNLLFVEGDKMAADVQKFVDAAAGTPFAHDANMLESKVLLVRVANWRMLATRDAKGFATFKANVSKAQAQIAVLENLDLSPELASILATVKSGIVKYAEAFDKTGPDLVRGDELYYKSVTPVIVDATGEMDKTKEAIGKAFDKTNTETRDLISSTITMQELVAGLAVLLGLAIAFLIARGIIRPLAGLTAGMKELASGNFGVILPGLDRKDEVGDMAQAVETFKVKAEDKAREEAETKIKQDEVLARQRKAEMARMADDFESAVGQIVATVSSASTQLEASANTLTSTAERSQELATTVAAASEEASTNVQSVASATEELTSSVNEISRQVQESARMAGDAVGQARSTTERVSELSKAATRIGDVVELINTIAGQTNLLALNATIEAARAGEAGRGFAVVASEVKALAEQTAKATGEIGQQIAGIQAATQDSVGAIKEISGTIERLSEISSTIAAAVEEQGAATQEISRNVQQAAIGTQQVSSNVTDVQRGATERGRPPRKCCPPRRRCPRIRTASSSRSASSSTQFALPDDGAGTAGGAAGRLRNRTRWYSQPIATSTRPRQMNDRAR